MKNKTSLQSYISPKIRNKRGIIASVGLLCAAVVIFSTFTNGPEEGRLPGYSWRQLISIDSSMVFGEKTFLDYPIFVRLQSPDLRQQEYGGKVYHPKGYDLRFTLADGAEITEHIIKSYNPEIGELIAWVRIDTMNRRKFSNLFLYYGNASISEPPLQSVAFRPLEGFLIEGLSDESAIGEKFSADWIATEYRNVQNPDSFLSFSSPEFVEMPLPVEIDYLDAKIKGGLMVLLQWGTTAEFENEQFVIEKSIDGRQFFPLDKMAGGDLSEVMLRYSYSDPKPVDGPNYYRLKQISFNRHYTYSPILLTDFNQMDKGLEVLSVGPKTFTDSLSIELVVEKNTQCTFQVYSEDGVMLLENQIEAQKGSHWYILNDLAMFPKGRYVLIVMGEDQKLHDYSLYKLQ